MSAPTLWHHGRRVEVVRYHRLDSRFVLVQSEHGAAWAMQHELEVRP